jgi:hypothetical protein
MKAQQWYIVFLICWAIFVLPGFLLGLFMVRGDITAMIPRGPISPVDMLAWVVGIIVLISPAILAPFGLRRRNTTL